MTYKFLTKNPLLCAGQSAVEMRKYANDLKVGGISKTDLRRMLAWAEVEFSLPILASFLDATPTAELRPLGNDAAQTDEEGTVYI